MRMFHPATPVTRTVLALALGHRCRGPLAAQYYKPLTNARWVLPGGGGTQDVQFSPDVKTRTDRLPPVSQITGNRSAQVQLEYGAGQNHGSSAVELVSPPGAQVSCPSVTPGQVLFTCTAGMQWLRSLTSDVTVRLRAKSMNPQVQYLDGRFIAPPNLVFLSRIDGPGSVIKGNVAEFSLVLAGPAPSGGVTVTYQAEPANCFATGQRRVNAVSGTIDVPANQQYRSLTLTTAGCNSGNAIIKTWTHERLDQTPYYVTKTITLRDRRQ